MPFFQPAFTSHDAAFLHFLSELDQSAPQQKVCPARRQCAPKRQETFTPRFDVTETTSTYELFGELPGLAREDLEIEFADAQTIIIKGKTARAGTETVLAVQEPEKEVLSDNASEKSHTATVEDDYDEADTPLDTSAIAEATPAAEPQQAETAKPKFWVSERRVGTFARSFSFSQRVENDGVQASLKNGVLHVIVPKVLKSRKVIVSVA